MNRMTHPRFELITPAGVAAALERIKVMDGTVGAFACMLDEAAARRELERLQGPLAGLAIGVKDIFDTADLPTGYGSPIYSDGRAAKTDAAMVGAIRRAGGLVIGKTTTTEFAYLNPTATLNPNAPGRTPGGSSAGSAAAVAAGMIPFAIGSQTGGSVIRPASYCGVAGFKPSFGMLPTAGLKCFSWSLDTVGLFARSVGELAWFAQAVSGHELAVTQASHPWVVGVPQDYPWGEASPSARHAVDVACAALEAAGAQVRRIQLPSWVGDVHRAHDVIQGYEAWRALAREMDSHPAALSPILHDYLRTAGGIAALDYEAAQGVAARARAQCAGWFEDFNVVLTPGAPDEAPQGYGSTGASTFNRAWTLLGLPCLSVPGVRGLSGCPMGVQLTGGPGADLACLQAGHFLGNLLAADAASRRTAP